MCLPARRWPALPLGGQPMVAPTIPLQFTQIHFAVDTVDAFSYYIPTKKFVVNNPL